MKRHPNRRSAAQIQLHTIRLDLVVNVGAAPDMGRELRCKSGVSQRGDRSVPRGPEALMVADWLLEPRGPENPRGTDGRASVLPRAPRTSPVVLGCIDCAGADRRTVERTNVPNPDAASQ